MKARRWHAIVVRLLEAGFVVTALFSIATLFDEWHRLLELFAHFRLQYFAAAVFFLLAFAFLKWRIYILLSLMLAGLNGWYVVPWYLPADTPSAATADLRLLQANLLHSNGNAEALLELVATEAPDLIVLQELTPAWQQAIRRLHREYPYRVIESRDDPFGIGLYSKFPLDSSAVMASVPLGLPEISASVRVAGQTLNVIATHPMQPLGGDNYGARNLQLDGVARLAGRTPTPLLLVGDLNTTIWAHHYRRVEQLSGLRNARQGFGVLPTWPTFLPLAYIPIDHCLVSDDIAVIDIRTGPRIGSDHLPLLVDLSLPAAAARTR